MHFSNIVGIGYRNLDVGQEVVFTFEPSRLLDRSISPIMGARTIARSTPGDRSKPAYIVWSVSPPGLDSLSGHH